MRARLPHHRQRRADPQAPDRETQPWHSQSPPGTMGRGLLQARQRLPWESAVRSREVGHARSSPETSRWHRLREAETRTSKPRKWGARGPDLEGSQAQPANRRTTRGSAATCFSRPNLSSTDAWRQHTHRQASRAWPKGTAALCNGVSRAGSSCCCIGSQGQAQAQEVREDRDLGGGRCSATFCSFEPQAAETVQG